MFSNALLFIYILFFPGSVLSEETAIKVYSKEEFSLQLDKRHNFIMFYAPWCSHCKKLTPVWEELAKEINSKYNNLAVAQVDCTVHTELCSIQDITGYPTLKLYQKGENEGKKFRGSRDLSSLKTFILEELENTDDALNLDEDSGPSVLVDLTDETFEDHVSAGSHFVKFFAPWCSHCQTLAPTWHELAETLRNNDEVNVAKIDCTKSIKICSVYDIMSYPTLLWIHDGKKVDTYQGARSLDDLTKYVTKMMQPDDLKNPEEITATLETEKSVKDLNGENFQFHIENGYTFVKFFAPWCGHCKRLAPTWEELAEKLSAEGKVQIAHVNCTREENKDLCNDQEVEGYPTLFFYRNGAKISEYNGSRVLEDLLEFVKRHSSHDEL